MSKRLNHITKIHKSQSFPLRVAELFAGVGGFRIGLDRASKNTQGKGFETIWSNQREPSTKKQHASEVYRARFGDEGHSNEDIAKVRTADIPDHDMLVGGFPCQDYSVARTLSHAAGLQGKKGVLWWEIHRILREKGDKAPSYLFLENVDRLIKSPASLRGRDFAIMLSSLAQLGYAVEWRVINAADYGKPQRRKRVFILGYKKGTPLEQALSRSTPHEWILKNGVIASKLLVKPEPMAQTLLKLDHDPVSISQNFKELFPENIAFYNAGIMHEGKVLTLKTEALFNGESQVLMDVLLPHKEVPAEYFISERELTLWKKLKGAKKEERVTKGGFTYMYSEGPVAFPDHLDKASRTIVTGEGGSTASRFKHAIKTPSGKYRRLTPLELERLCQFPDHHTQLEGVSDVKRAFFMGNALVVGIIEDIGSALLGSIKRHTQEPIASKPLKRALQRLV